MAAIVRQWRETPFVRNLADRNLINVPPKVWRKEIRAQFNFVQRTVRYTQDTTETELLQTPYETWKRGAGDCDDSAIYIQALLESIGYHTRFVACGRVKGVFEHVYSQAMLPNNRQLVSLDTTENQPCGWEPTGMTCWLPKDVNS